MDGLVHRRGRSAELEGRRLDEVVDKLKRSVLEVEVGVEVQFERRVYAGRRRAERRRLRLVGVRDPGTGEYWHSCSDKAGTVRVAGTVGRRDAAVERTGMYAQRVPATRTVPGALWTPLTDHECDYWFYLTSLPETELDAESLAQLYACRWQIELVFKELKSHYRLDELPTRKAPVVEALMLSSIVTLLVSRRLLDAVRRRRKRERHRAREGRWASVFSVAALSILDLVSLSRQTAMVLARRLEPMLLDEVVDPNKSRLLLLERVENGLAWAR